ncbi:MAG: 2-oxoacid:acceptor oxidoreductase family protein [Clostridiales bacterium]|jgi:2-oxoglutarate ferredoxin oxidoreductase subunit gamma|nr:2-oxoacid:acceptor oxidoreductase family protein [Clostridiales bacterium]
MENKMIFAGYGGQGMLLCGQILAYAAMIENKEVTWLPSYGPEMRGGAASCSVIMSDKTIGSPVVQVADVVVAMNQPSFDKFESAVKPGGTLIYNTSMINEQPRRTDIKYFPVGITEIANELGNLRVANMVALGCINGLLDCVKNESIIESLKHKLGASKANLIAINEKGIQMGIDAVKAIKA